MNETDDDLPENWPRSGDLLFAQDNRGYDAQLAESYGERMYRMKEAFKNAADVLIRHTEENIHERGNLVWPIVFCYRQYIELTLKDVIARHGHKIEPPIEPKWNIHTLGKLWGFCKTIMEATLVETKIEEIPEIPAIEACIAEFEEADPGSYAFRFPTDTKGQGVELPFHSIDLCHLRMVMDGMYTFFDANDSHLDHYLG